MKRSYRLVGLLAGLLLTALFVLYVVHALHGHDLTVYATPRAFAGIVVAALLWTASLPLNALAWHGLLAGLGTRKSWRELTAILGITQLAKYVPGNVVQYLSRAGMSLSRGIPARALGVTITVEIVLVISAAMAMGIGTGMWSVVGIAAVRHHGKSLMLVAGLLLAAIAILLTFRKFGPVLLHRLAPQHAHVLAGDLLPPRGMILRAFAIYLLVYACLGLSLVILAHWILPNALQDNWLLVASFSLAWVVGFVTPGAPAGLGVREGLLLLMLSPVYSSAAASVLVIALRLATTLGDIVCFASGLLILPKSGLVTSSKVPS